MGVLTERNSLLSKFLSVTVLCFFFTACQNPEGESNLKIPGVIGPTLTLDGPQRSIRIDMVFEKLQVDLGGRVSIPQYPNSFIEFTPHLTGGTLMAIHLDIDDIDNDDLLHQNAETLPGGRAIPGVMGGKLPAIAFTIEQLGHTTFYMGEEVFGIFVPLKLPKEIPALSKRFYVNKRAAGLLGYIGADENDENSGLYLFLNLNSQMRSKLQRIANKYR